MPIGSTTWSSGSGAPRPITVERVVHRGHEERQVLEDPEQAEVEHDRGRQRPLADWSDGVRAITCAANVLTSVEPISSRTQRGSTQP